MFKDNRYLGLDLGERTLGVALSDITHTIATTYKTIRYDNIDILLEELEQIIKEFNVVKIVLGMPKNMNNTIGERAQIAINFKKTLENKFKINVDMQDERLTTVEAEHYMLETDLSRKKRKKKIDSLAASIILQTYLDRWKDDL